MNLLSLPVKTRLTAWLLLLTCALIYLVLAFGQGNPINTSLLALLPQDKQNPLKERALANLDKQLSNRLIYLVGHKDKNTAINAATGLGKLLANSQQLNHVNVEVSENKQSEFAQFYYPFRQNILSQSQQLQITQDNGEQTRQNALLHLYNPLSGVSSAQLQADPFLLFPASMSGLGPVTGNLELDNNHLIVKDKGWYYVFVSATTAINSFSLNQQETLANEIQAAQVQILADFPATQILKTGLFFYTQAGSQSAQSEISTIGFGSLLGVLLLILVVFRSLSPLWLALLSVGAGVTCALAMTIYWFGEVHILTLVFGASLIGVSIDYAFHYLAEHLFEPQGTAREKILHKIYPGITLGLITSVIAYLSLLADPFPGLRQLAIFSSTGLVVAYLTVLYCFPIFDSGRYTAHTPPFVAALNRLINFWRQLSATKSIGLCVSLLLVSIWGLTKLAPNDDIRLLQSVPVELKSQEVKIKELLGNAADSQFFLLQAANQQSLLEKEQVLINELNTLRDQHVLLGFQATSQWIPSIKQQQQSRQAYRLLMDQQRAPFFASIGATLTPLQTAPEAFITPRSWQLSPVSKDMSFLWLGQQNNNQGESVFASLVLLSGIQQLGPLASLADAHQHITFISKADDISALFAEYRIKTSYLLAAAYALILLLMICRYGLKRAVLLIIPPLLAGSLALAFVGFSGEDFNLFNLVALILVLGIGVDYTLFFAENQQQPASTLLAISLSALTTVLAFGLLALSNTQAIASFGVTVLIGITAAYLLSPLAIRKISSQT